MILDPSIRGAVVVESLAREADALLLLQAWDVVGGVAPGRQAGAWLRGLGAGPTSVA